VQLRHKLKLSSQQHASTKLEPITMGRRSDHSREELQALIVDATLSLVKQKGASNVTARQIAQAVGYTPGMLYSIFTNLQDIFLHVNQVGVQTLFGMCTNAQHTSTHPAESILAMGLAYLRFAEDHTHQFDLMFSRQAQDTAAQQSPTALTNQISSLFELIEDELRALNPAASNEQIRLGARALWSGVHGTAALRLSNQLYLHSAHADRDIVKTLISGFINSWQKSP